MTSFEEELRIARIDDARRRFLATLPSSGSGRTPGPDGVDLSGVPERIADSWSRSVRAGVDVSGRRTPRVRVVAGSLLGRCARAPMAELVSSLGSLPLGVVLSDARSRVVARGCTGPDGRQLLDWVDLAPGADFSEDEVGTNGIGTVAATGTPLLVAGGAHFQDRFTRYACAGAPILDPVAGALFGVVDLTGRVEDASPLMRSLAVQTARRIEAELHRAIARTVTARPSGMTVVVPGIGPVPARDDSSAPAVGTASGRREPTFPPSVPTGEAAVTALVDRLSLGAVAGSGAWQLARRGLRGSLEHGETCLLLGEVGVGKVSLVREVAAGVRAPIVVITAHDLRGSRRIADAVDPRRLGDAGSAAPVIVLRNIHAFSAPAMERAMGLLRAPRISGVPVRIVCTAQTEYLDRGAPMLAYVSRTILVPALRRRHAEFPAIVRTILDTISPGAWARLDPAALRVLEAGVWPGNVHQLTDALSQAVLARPTGTIRPDDLPPHAFHAALEHLGRAAQDERALILKTLYQEHGNRSATARRLGISRSTLYRRLAEYGAR